MPVGTHQLQLAALPQTMMAMQTSPIVEDREPRVPRPAPSRRPID